MIFSIILCSTSIVSKASTVDEVAGSSSQDIYLGNYPRAAVNTSSEVFGVIAPDDAAVYKMTYNLTVNISLTSDIPYGFLYFYQSNFLFGDLCLFSNPGQISVSGTTGTTTVTHSGTVYASGSQLNNQKFKFYGSLLCDVYAHFSMNVDYDLDILALEEIDSGDSSGSGGDSEESGEQLSFKGEWSNMSYIYADGPSVYAESFISLLQESNVDYFKTGHSYNVTGLIRSWFGSTNIDLYNYSVHIYFIAGDKDVLVYSNDAGWIKGFDFNIDYTGGEVGFLFCCSFTNKDKSKVGYVFPKLDISDENLLTFTDLGEGISEADILKRIDKTTTSTDKTIKEVDSTTKGIWATIKEFFGSFFQNLIDSVIHLFVPTAEEMSELIDRLNQFFSDTFGFLYYPFEFLIKAFNVFLSADSETALVFPGFSINGIQVWDDMTFDITQYELVNTIFGYVRIGTGTLLALAFVNYLRNFFDKRFGGGGS